jgi:hypothetical protein
MRHFSTQHQTGTPLLAETIAGVYLGGADADHQGVCCVNYNRICFQAMAVMYVAYVFQRTFSVQMCS